MRSHGAYSPARVKRVARAQRRRFLDRSGLAVGELTGVESAFLDSWARCQAKVELIDAYCAEHGLIREDGTPQPVLALYVSLVNAARHAMTRLQEALNAADRPRANVLDAYLAEHYGNGDGS